MNQGPLVKGNPLRISVYLLVIAYLFGEFLFPKYPLFYAINLIGIIGFGLATRVWNAKPKPKEKKGKPKLIKDEKNVKSSSESSSPTMR